MGNSFLEYGNNHVRLKDGFIARFAAIISDSAASFEFPPVIQEICRSWEYAALESGPGLIDFDFTPIVMSQELRKAIIDLLIKTRQRIESDKKILSGAWMNERSHSHGEYFEDIEAGVLLAAYDRFYRFIEDICSN